MNSFSVSIDSYQLLKRPCKYIFGNLSFSTPTFLANKSTNKKWWFCFRCLSSKSNSFLSTFYQFLPPGNEEFTRKVCNPKQISNKQKIMNISEWKLLSYFAFTSECKSEAETVSLQCQNCSSGLPELTFHNFKASTYGDWRVLWTLKMLVAWFPGSKCCIARSGS